MTIKVMYFISFCYFSVLPLMCFCTYGDFTNIERPLRNFIVTVEKPESVICKHILRSLK